MHAPHLFVGIAAVRIQLHTKCNLQHKVSPILKPLRPNCPTVSGADLENVTVHTIRDGVKFSGFWVKLVAEHTVFCRKFNLLSQFGIFLL